MKKNEKKYEIASHFKERNTFFSVSRPFTTRKTILVFDSGVGGLSVYNEIQKLLPNFHYIYVFDNIAFPYGEKSHHFIINRVVKILTAIQQRYSLALAVIACNTASIVSLPELRKKFQFPVVGAVPAIKPAAQLTKNKIIGLLATRCTLNHSYTHELINRFANNCQIETLNSDDLVKIAEEKMYGKAVPIKLLTQIFQPWLEMSNPPDTVVLGCTHFPLLRDELLTVLPENIHLVDSGIAIARHNVRLLNHKFTIAKSTEKNIAYCISLTPKIKQLLSTCFKGYNFEKLEEIKL